MKTNTPRRSTCSTQAKNLKANGLSQFAYLTTTTPWHRRTENCVTGFVTHVNVAQDTRQHPKAGSKPHASKVSHAKSPTHHKQHPKPLKHPAGQSVPSLRPPDVNRHILATTCKLPGQRTAENDQPRSAKKYSPPFENRARGRSIQDPCPKHKTRMKVPQLRLGNRRLQRFTLHKADHGRLKTPQT